MSPAAHPPVEDVKVVKAPAFVAFRTAEHGDLDATLPAETAPATLPRTISESPRVNVPAISSSVVPEFLIGSQCSQHCGGALQVTVVVSP